MTSFKLGLMLYVPVMIAYASGILAHEVHRGWGFIGMACVGLYLGILVVRLRGMAK